MDEFQKIVDEQAKAIRKFSQERDAAFVDFVKTGNAERFLAFSKKYNMEVPDDERIMAAGIYKAVQECTAIPYEVKEEAIKKCFALGFSPFIYWWAEDWWGEQ